MYQISPETEADFHEVETLYDLCFVPGRTALSSYRLRDGVDKVADLCLVLRGDDGILKAAIRFWPVRVDWARALLLGPIAVHPTAQGEGLGAILMRDSLMRAQETGWMRVLLVGDEPYYGRFGFSRLDGVVMPPPTNPDRVLGLALCPGAWDGIAGHVTRDIDEENTPDLVKTDDDPHIQGESRQSDLPCETVRKGRDDPTDTSDIAADHRSGRA